MMNSEMCVEVYSEGSVLCIMVGTHNLQHSVFLVLASCLLKALDPLLQVLACWLKAFNSLLQVLASFTLFPKALNWKHPAGGLLVVAALTFLQTSNKAPPTAVHEEGVVTEEEKQYRVVNVP
jgi:hypothetical protein